MPVINDRLILVTSRTRGLPRQATLRDCTKQPFILISNERAQPSGVTHLPFVPSMVSIPA